MKIKNSRFISKNSQTNLFMKSKKGITPVVATALLIVVAVIAVVGFMTWFNYYQSGLNSKIETQSSNDLGNSGIQNVIGTDLYFKNAGSSNITITSVKIGGNDCGVFGNFSPGMVTIPLGNNCISNLATSTPQVVVYTNKQVFSKSVYISTATSSLCSGLAGGTWIEVPGNSALGTSNFCIMKFDAKNVSGIATSQASLTPWVNIDQLNARIACQNLGSKYHLVTNAEWTTIARNAEGVGKNWNSTIAGQGYMYSGHNDNSPPNALAASTSDSNGYYLTGNSAPSNQRRTLYLSNGQVIWDFAGNVYEWNNNTISNTTGGNLGITTGTFGWYEWNTISSTYHTLYGSLSNSLNSTQGIGEVYSGNETSATYGFLRGGCFVTSGTHAGVFTLSLNSAPSASSMYLGFRCAYTP